MPPVRLDQWTSTVVLGDGDTATVRPITLGDQEALRVFHERQSGESKYRRFFSAKPTLSASELAHFTDLDFVNRVALVVERHGEFIGWASYERWPNRDDAEAAFMVDDEHHGKGIATLLLEHLAAIARTNGIRRFTAEVLAENRAMLTVFARAGWPLQRRFDSGVIDLDFDLDNTTEFIDSVERREQRADSRAMARMLIPRSMAIIGASDTPGSVGHALWSNAARGFDGPLFPVNPNRPTVGGRPTFASVADIDEEVSLAVVAVPHQALAATIDDCIAAHVRGAIVITAIDGTVIDMKAIVQRARRNGLRIIGPSSMGVASPRPDIAIQAALIDVTLPQGGVAISMQSGTLASSLLRLADQLKMGISWFVSLGDKSDVSGNDLLQFWLDDDATSVIAIYTEAFGNPRKFARLARRVSQRRPIVAVRTGAALIGPGTGALYQQAGVIEVPTVVAMLDTARVMATQPPMHGDCVAVITNSRSPGVLARAAIEAAGLRCVDPPISLDWSSDDRDFEAAVRAALESDGVDAVLVIHAPPVASAVSGPVAEIDSAAADCHKPVVAVMLGALDGPLQPGSPVQRFAFPEPAAAVLGRLHSYWQWRATEGLSSPEAPRGMDVPGALRILRNSLDAGRTQLTFDDTIALLATYGVDLAPGRLVPARSGAATADEIGYPVAVKAVRRRVGHSVQAGVALDLTTADDVVTAIGIMQTHLGDGADEVLVQRMVPPGVDLRVHVTTDGQLGPVITVGLGGANADLIGDQASRLAPVSAASAASMLRSTRAAAALDSDDEDLVVDLIVRVAQLVSDRHEIVEADLNPVIVGNGECWVTDAIVRIARPTRTEPAIRRLE
jgi:acyl-CoA synthetase (NDP forming)/GNAT superfamily N-acetyltransferase